LPPRETCSTIVSMNLIVGVDVGSATTEACVAAVAADAVAYLGSARSETSGAKGTLPNVAGALRAIDRALGRAGRTYAEIGAILVSEPAQVVADAFAPPHQRRPRPPRAPVEQFARALAEATGVPAIVGGSELEMAVRGTFADSTDTTPVALLDLGAGSTDAVLVRRGELLRSCHVAGGGDLVTELIGAELELDEPALAEAVKTGAVLPLGIDPARVRQVRRGAKRRVFAADALRALREIAPRGGPRTVGLAVLIGGSALDFEIPLLVAEAFAAHGVACATANVRVSAGPRSAVTTGLVETFHGANPLAAEHDRAAQ
jgi:hypothetical protein